MANFTISPNMNLSVPTVGVDPGPDWANNLNASLTSIDSHNHTSGQGVQIPPAGLNINASLPMNNNSLTAIQSLVFLTQSSIATLQALYVKGVDLYYNDGSSNVIQITSGGGVNATSSGITSGTASASFVSSVLVVNKATNTPASIQSGPLLIGFTTAASNFITLQPPSALSSGSYSLTLPAVPGSTSFMTLDASGNMGASISTSGGITNSNIANGTITGAKLVAGTITSTQIASATILGSNIAAQTISGSNLVVGINIPGNAVQIANRYNVSINTNGTLNSGVGVIRGGISAAGTLTTGEGFTPAHGGTGSYTITYATAFVDSPSIVVTTATGSATFGVVAGNSTSAATISIFNTSGSPTDDAFYFTIIGQKVTP